MKTKRKVKCPICGDAWGETDKEYDDQQIDQAHFILEDKSGKGAILLLCEDCDVLYGGDRDTNKEIA